MAMKINEKQLAKYIAEGIEELQNGGSSAAREYDLAGIEGEIKAAFVRGLKEKGSSLRGFIYASEFDGIMRRVRNALIKNRIIPEYDMPQNRM